MPRRFPRNRRAQPAWSSIELPPDLPMPVFTSTESFNSRRVGALAVYCSDGQHGDAFDEFCHRRLDVPRSTASPCPAGRVARPRHRPPRPAGGRRGADAIPRDRPRPRPGDPHRPLGLRLLRAQRAARRARASACRSSSATSRRPSLFREWFPKIDVATYLAMQNGGSVSFYEIGRVQRPAPATTTTARRPARASRGRTPRLRRRCRWPGTGVGDNDTRRGAKADTFEERVIQRERGRCSGNCRVSFLDPRIFRCGGYLSPFSHVSEHPPTTPETPLAGPLFIPVVGVHALTAATPPTRLGLHIFLPGKPILRVPKTYR